MSTVPMADTIGYDLKNIPVDFPKVGYYATGGGSVQAPPESIRRFTKSGLVSIDQTAALQAYAVGKTDVADVEPGAGTSAAFIAGTRKRQAAGMYGNLYCDVADLAENVNALLADGLDLARVVFWVADWNLDQTQASARCGTQSFASAAHGTVKINVGAVQWASPKSNPDTLLPGTKLTLKAANVDLSETVAWWFARPVPELPIMTGVVVTGDLRVTNVASTDGGKSWATHG
jgi:hypothetical protein